MSDTTNFFGLDGFDRPARNGMADFDDTPERRAARELAAQVDPLPLRRPQAPPEPFPIDALGPVLAPAAHAIADRVRCAPGLAGVSVLAAAALAVQGRGDVDHPLAMRPRPTSLFFVSVASSGDRKSAADAEALAPCRQRETELREEYDAALPDFGNAKRAFDAALAAAEKAGKGDRHAIKAALDALGPAPLPPLSPLLRVTEPTAEGLHKLLAAGQPGIGIFSDEGGAFTGGFGMTAENRLRTLVTLCTLWDAAPLSRVRAGDGASVLIGKRLSMHLMMQPGVAAGLLSDPVAQDQGFLSRQLACRPESIAGTRLARAESPGTAAGLAAYHKHILDGMRIPLPLATGKRNELAPPALALSRPARGLWIDVHDAIETRLGAGGEYRPIAGLASKLAEHALRIAGVLALIENPFATTIGENHVANAAVIGDHFGSEALRLWGDGIASPAIREAEKLLNWLRAAWPERAIGLPQIYRLGPNSIREKAAAQRAVEVLEAHGWLVPIEGKQTIAGATVRTAWRIVRQEGSGA